MSDPLPHGPFPFAWTELSDEENKRIKAAVSYWPFNDLVRYPGNVLLPRAFTHIADRLYNLELKEDDIFIITYPKCGTTWTQEMIWQIVNGVDKEKGKLPLFVRTPFLEMGCFVPPPHLKPKDAQTRGGLEMPPIESLPEAMREGMRAMMKHKEDPIEYTRTLSGRRVIKCHLPMDFLPPGIVDKCKVVYVARNPKDVAVSYYHHYILLHGWECDFEEFHKQFKEDLLCYGSYWHHILGGWKYKDHKNFSFIWFEEMKKDQKSVIQGLCKFLDQPLTEEKVNELVESLKFENFKKNPSVNMEAADPNQGKKGTFIRKGIVGDWKNHFDEETDQQWDKWIQENIEGTDLIIPGK